jgi:hypothetical protein
MKKRFFILALIHLFVINAIFGQENVLYHEIQQMKNNKMEFKTVSVFKETSVIPDVLSLFVNSKDVHFFEYIPVDLKKDDSQAILLTIPSRNNEIVPI